MAHWPYETEREDGDGHDEDREAAFKARKWLRSVADRSRNPQIRDMMGDLRSLELAAGGLFLGNDQDDDFDDVDEMGPF